jgi:HD-like signal output (HDOD) protein
MDPAATPFVNKQKFREKVERLYNLPTLPDLMVKFSAMARDPSVSMTRFAEELSRDQTITGKMLRLVNSSFYGFPGRIGTVTQALIILGIDAVKGLIVTSNVFDSLTPEAYPLWRHSILVSLASRHIALMLNTPDSKEMTEESAVAGILHDIGTVIFFLESADEYRVACRAAAQRGVPLWRMEREMFGFDHAEIGKWVCDKWTLPAKLAVPIGFHHEPEKAKEHALRTCIVSAANSVVNACGAAAVDGVPLEDIRPCVQDALKLTKATLKDLVEKIGPEFEAMQDLGPKDLS